MKINVEMEMEEFKEYEKFISNKDHYFDLVYRNCEKYIYEYISKKEHYIKLWGKDVYNLILDLVSKINKGLTI
jgi:hypothetical protein